MRLSQNLPDWRSVGAGVSRCPSVWSPGTRRHRRFHPQKLKGVSASRRNHPSPTVRTVGAPANPHFSPAFYCGDGSGHVYCVALCRAPRRTVEYVCGALGRAPCIHARLRRLATKPGEKCGLKPAPTESNGSFEKVSNGFSLQVRFVQFMHSSDSATGIFAI